MSAAPDVPPALTLAELWAAISDDRVRVGDMLGGVVVAPAPDGGAALRVGRCVLVGVFHEASPLGLRRVVDLAEVGSRSGGSYRIESAADYAGPVVPPERTP